MNEENKMNVLEEHPIIIGEEELNNLMSSQKDQNKINITEDKKENVVDGIHFEIQIDPELLIKGSQELEDYICPLCKGLLLNPVIDNCSHTFCKDCFNKYYKIKKQCPITKQKLTITELTHVDVISKSIGKKEMKCKNYYKGCNWIGKVSDIDFHLKNECGKSLVKCIYKNCNEEILREELQNHILNCENREEKCNDCNMMFPLKNLNEHYNKCVKKKVKCIQGCGVIVERGEMDSHIKNFCENSVIECKFKEFGCMDKFKKKEMNSKMESGCFMHLNLIADYIIQMSKQLKDNNEKSCKIEVRLDKIEEILNKTNKELMKDGDSNNEINSNINKNISNTNILNANGSNHNNINNNNINNMVTNNNIINNNKNDNNNTPNNNSNNNINTLNNKNVPAIYKNNHQIIHNNTINLNNSIINNNNNGNNNQLVSQFNRNYLQSPKTSQKVINPLQTKLIVESHSNPINNSNEPILNKKREREKIEEKIPESPFDMERINEQIIIKGNKATLTAKYLDSHLFLFANPEYDIDLNNTKIRNWKINLLTKSKWIGFGLCDKSLVLYNKQTFCTYLKDNHFNNGSYLISSNGFSWNCNNKLENNKKINFPNFNEPFLSFNLSYNPILFELSFIHDSKLIKKLTNVKPISLNNKILTPCIVFLDSNNQIELLFNNE